MTTGLATWIEEGSPFLLDLTKRLLCNVAESPSGFSQDLHYRVAVVDRLPGPPPSLLSKDGLSNMDFSRGIGGVYEGFCMRIGTGPRLPTNSESSFEPHIRWRQRTNGVNFPDAILLPANTLFINGKPSTMFEVTAPVSGMKGLAGLKLLPRRELVEFRLNSRIVEQQFLTVPLTPLTQPRRITASMGNVVSQIESGPAGKESMPASTELEPAVSSFLAEQQINSTQVFASIQHIAHPMPDLNEPSDTRQETSERPNDRVLKDEKYIDGTVRTESFEVGILRKVTGGGGGWGAKRGLLSLDPSTDVADAEDSADMNFAFDDESEVGSPLRNIAQPGDTVQFFATTPRPSMEAEAEAEAESVSDVFGSSKLPPMDNKYVNVVTFGMIPSSSEIMAVPKTLAPTSWTVVPDAFGMLSEGGMSIAFSGWLSRQVFPKPQHPTANWTSKSYFQSTGLTEWRKSRVNVPYAAVTLLEHRPSMPGVELATSESSKSMHGEGPSPEKAETPPQPHQGPPKAPQKEREDPTLRPRKVLSGRRTKLRKVACVLEADETKKKPSKSTPEGTKILKLRKIRSSTPIDEAKSELSTPMVAMVSQTEQRKSWKMSSTWRKTIVQKLLSDGKIAAEQPSPQSIAQRHHLQKKKTKPRFRKILTDGKIAAEHDLRKKKTKPRFRKYLTDGKIAADPRPTDRRLTDRRPYPGARALKADSARERLDLSKMSWDDRMQLVSKAIDEDGRAP